MFKFRMVISNIISSIFKPVEHSSFEGTSPKPECTRSILDFWDFREVLGKVKYQSPKGELTCLGLDGQPISCT